MRNVGHNGCIDMVSPQCVSSGEVLDDFSVKKSCHNGYIDVGSPQCVFSNVL